MEAQPLAMVVTCVTFMLTEKFIPSFANMEGIALLAVSLLWWSMFVEHLTRTRHRNNSGRVVLSLLGWLVALAVVIGPALPSTLRGIDIPTTLIDVGFVTWLWRRGIYRACRRFEYAGLATSFKVGFSILLFILLLGIFIPQGQKILDLLFSVWPLFFLSGLIALSLARLGAIRNARNCDGSQADPTRIWLLALTILCCGIFVLVIVLGSVFSFTRFELAFHALTPLWDALGTLVGWIFYAFIIIVLAPIFHLFTFLVGLLSHNTASKQQQTMPSSPFSHLQQGPQAISPELLDPGRWAFLILVCLIVLLILRASLQRWFSGDTQETLEEVREELDAPSLLRERWQTWWSRLRQRKTSISLESPDPTSARARYREFLQKVAQANSQLARRPTETADEYKARLLPYLESVREQDRGQDHSHTLAEYSAILDALTHVYTHERYGGRETSGDQRANLQAWVTRLVVRLTGKR